MVEKYVNNALCMTANENKTLATCSLHGGLLYRGGPEYRPQIYFRRTPDKQA